MCQDKLHTDVPQFGFKPCIGCSYVIFSVQTVINYFVERVSSIFAAALDLNKAFANVNQFKLFGALLGAGIALLSGVLNLISMKMTLFGHGVW